MIDPVVIWWSEMNKIMLAIIAGVSFVVAFSRAVQLFDGDGEESRGSELFSLSVFSGLLGVVCLLYHSAVGGVFQIFGLDTKLSLEMAICLGTFSLNFYIVSFKKFLRLPDLLVTAAVASLTLLSFFMALSVFFLIFRDESLMAEYVRASVEDPYISQFSGWSMRPTKIAVVAFMTTVIWPGTVSFYFVKRFMDKERTDRFMLFAGGLGFLLTAVTPLFFAIPGFKFTFIALPFGVIFETLRLNAEIVGQRRKREAALFSIIDELKFGLLGTKNELERRNKKLMSYSYTVQQAAISSSVIHDIGSPLTSVIFCLGRLRQLHALPEGERFLFELEAAISQIHEVIVWSRGMESLHGSLDEGIQVSLEDLVKKVIRVFRYEAIKRNVTVEVSSKGLEGVMVQDEAEVTIVLTNILFNGLSAIDTKAGTTGDNNEKLVEPGKIEVCFGTIPRAKKSGEESGEESEAIFDEKIFISVRDNGCGLSEDDMKRMHEPFFPMVVARVLVSG